MNPSLEIRYEKHSTIIEQKQIKNNHKKSTGSAGAFFSKNDFLK